MKRTITEIKSDLSGDELAKPFRFAVDGTEYEIDLTEKERAELIGLLDPYTKAGRRQRSKGVRRYTSNPDAIKIREWAKAQGEHVAPRGRIPFELRNRYYAAKQS